MNILRLGAQRRHRLGLALFAAAVTAVSTLGQGCGSDAGSTFPDGGDGSSTSGDGGGDGAFVDDAPTIDPDGSLGNPFQGCEEARDKAARLPVYMLFVLDGSRSMYYKPGNTELSAKWPAAIGALDAIFDDLAAKGDPAFGAGITGFCDDYDKTCGDNTAGPYSKMDVPIARVDAAQAAALHARIDTHRPLPPGEPGGGTPTYEVLSGQYAVLEAFTPPPGLEPGGRRVLVLITDGVPDTDMPAGANEAPGSLKLAKDESSKNAPAVPVTTFAVGVGELSPANLAVYDPKFMGALGVAGGSPRQPCDPNEALDATKMCHFQITPGAKTVDQLKQDFLDAINTIRNKVLTCEYQLEHPDGGPDLAADPSKVNVVYTDGGGTPSVIPKNATDGWSYNDDLHPTKVVLNGPTCAKVKADPAGAVEIVLGCLTQVK